MSVQRTFDGACEVIHILDCDPSLFHPDPCDCAKSYRCTNNEIITTTCSEDTLWDVKANSCFHKNIILLKDECDTPWTRCNVSDARLSQLQAYCLNTTTTTDATPSTTLGKQTEQDGGGINPGLVIGLIVAGAVLAVAVIAVIFLYLRHRKKTEIKKGRGTVENREYFEGGNEHDPYDFIDERMTDPTYHGEPAGSQSNGSCANAAHTGTLGETAVYDNSATRDTNPSSGYTATLTRSEHEPDVPYATLNRDNNSNEINANTPKSDRELSGPTHGESSENTSDIGTAGHPPEPEGLKEETGTPHYFTLEREQT